MRKYKPVKIFCPKCDSYIGKHDGRSTMNLIARCRKCGNRVVYHVDGGEIEVKGIPKRTCSSGMTFI